MLNSFLYARHLPISDLPRQLLRLEAQHQATQVFPPTGCVSWGGLERLRKEDQELKTTLHVAASAGPSGPAQPWLVLSPMEATVGVHVSLVIKNSNVDLHLASRDRERCSW